MVSSLLVFEKTELLFHYDENLESGEEAEADKVIQLVTPILVSQRVLQEELASKVHEIKANNWILLISCHSFAGQNYNLILLCKEEQQQQISPARAFRNVACQFIHVLCGPSWHRLKTCPAVKETLANCIRFVRQRW